jgi:hypothetical protein
MKSDDKSEANEYNDRFSRLMFGPFPSRQAMTEHKKDETHFSDPLHQIDFMQLMKDIDTLVSSFEKIKPIVKQLTPLYNLFKNRS